MIKNQAGIITVDFLFSLILAAGMSILVFSLCYSMVVFEVTQYVVFASAREHSAGHISVETQQLKARQKYAALLSQGYIKNLFTNEWFSVSNSSDIEIRSGGVANFDRDYPSGTQNRPVMQGVRTLLIANILETSWPFIGKVQSEEGDGFTVRVASILLREPSQKECIDFMEKRANAIWNLPGTSWISYRKDAVSTAWEDNGC